MNILHIDASARQDNSVTRNLSSRIVEHLGGDVTRRDVSAGMPIIDQNWVEANFTPADQRTPAQKERLSGSDALVAELEAADTIVLGVPIYNFGVPAALKSWIDLIARVGLTFNYTSDGPVGKLTGKRAIVAIASGGTKAWSDIDFATPYLRHVLSFLGITDVTFIAADTLGTDTDTKIAQAVSRIDELPVAKAA